MKQPIPKGDMLKIIGQNYEEYYSEIIKTASECIETVFAVNFKEVDSISYSYDLVSQVKLPNNGRVHAGRALPKSGFPVISVKGNCTAEEDIWECPNMMRVYTGGSTSSMELHREAHNPRFGEARVTGVPPGARQQSSTL